MGCYFLLQEIFPGPRIEPVSLVSPICNPPNQYSPGFHSRLWMCREWQNPAVCIPSEFVSALTSKVHSLHSLFFFFYTVCFNVKFFSSLQFFSGDFDFQNILQLQCCGVVSSYTPGKGWGVPYDETICVRHILYRNDIIVLLATRSRLKNQL